MEKSITAFVRTVRGGEQLCFEELEDIAQTKLSCSCAENGFVIFGATKSVLAKIIYFSQTIYAAGELIGSKNINTGDVEETVSTIIDLVKAHPHAIDKSAGMRVTCHRRGEHAYNSQDVERRSGEFFHEAGFTIELNKPAYNILIFLEEEFCLVGFDWAGRELDKRAYRIFTSARSIKAPICALTVQFAKPKKDFVDPFGGDGSIAIEAALQANAKSPHEYQPEFLFQKWFTFDFAAAKRKKKGFAVSYADGQIRHLLSAKKNAKIGGVHDLINFAKADPSWLDTRFEKVTCMATHLIEPGKTTPEKFVRKLYEDLKDTCNMILKGPLCVITTKKELFLEVFSGYAITEELTLQTKHQTFYLLKLLRQ
ncbi:MAG: hypothetical protein H6502_01650 [Candidatus Woesearchaeota archaeon]|nr:MAG: hypothetical protein H6502_01650 [Candidatus Woesearchaeota archaeon]